MSAVLLLLCFNIYAILKLPPGANSFVPSIPYPVGPWGCRIHKQAPASESGEGAVSHFFPCIPKNISSEVRGSVLLLQNLLNLGVTACTSPACRVKGRGTNAYENPRFDKWPVAHYQWKHFLSDLGILPLAHLVVPKEHQSAMSLLYALSHEYAVILLGLLWPNDKALFGFLWWCTSLWIWLYFSKSVCHCLLNSKQIALQRTHFQDTTSCLWEKMKSIPC